MSGPGTSRRTVRTSPLRRSIRAVDDCLVTGYEPLIPSITLSDPDDRHVVAAALQAQADVIVTFNLKDFPAEALKPHSLEAVHPDDFILTMADSDPLGVMEAVAEVRRSLRKPPMTTGDVLAALRRGGVPRTSDWIAEELIRLSAEQPLLRKMLEGLGD